MPVSPFPLPVRLTDDAYSKRWRWEVSLDQLRAFIATVDEGSFSAAARKLYRVQSVANG
ncbi:MAG: helix-turn-helix domain-containing protein [Rhodanobacteraceae bacterium]